MSQKVDHQPMTITLSKPNRLSKFFHSWKQNKIVNETYIIHPTTNTVYCLTACGMLKFKFSKITNVMFDETKYVLSYAVPALESWRPLKYNCEAPCLMFKRKQQSIFIHSMHYAHVHCMRVRVYIRTAQSQWAMTKYFSLQTACYAILLQCTKPKV